MNDRATIVIPLAEVRSKVKPRSAPKGRQVDPDAREMIAALLGGRDAVGHLRRDLLVEYLHLIQDRFGHLSAAHMAALAEAMKISQTEVYEVATFYHHFDVIKEGEAVPAALTVRVCETLSCSMAGSAALLEKLPAILGKEVRVIEAPCIGRCAEAPAVCVGQHAFGHATVESVAKAVCEQDTKPTAQQTTTHVGLKQYLAEGGYQTLLAVLSGKRDVEAVITEMEHSGLRGLGGAGFPTGRKWRIVRGETGPRLMAVNIDEGEPGTFKDRYYLERDPHRFIEGMLIAAQVVGIDASYVYLRDEYHHCRIIIEAEMAAAQAWASGKGITLPKIEIRRGAGAYICGEESAMIESIEGKRGMPRLRPPYVAQVGLFGRPTLEHNFETLYWVRDILEKGASWFSGHGRNGRKGLRSFSVSGRVKQPGVHLAPAGITVRELIDEYCGGMLDGHTLYAYLPGGASGGILPASMGDIPLDFDTLQPHGRRELWSMYAVSCGDGKSGDAARRVEMENGPLGRSFAGDGRCVYLRVGAGGAESDSVRH